MTSHTTDYLKADMHRAMQFGARTMDVAVADVSELLARLEAAEARAAIEFGGKPLGYTTPDKVKAMLEGRRKFITIARRKDENFCVLVCYTE